jgi:hypothetical protein
LVRFRRPPPRASYESESPSLAGFSLRFKLSVLISKIHDTVTAASATTDDYNLNGGPRRLGTWSRKSPDRDSEPESLAVSILVLIKVRVRRVRASASDEQLTTSTAASGGTHDSESGPTSSRGRGKPAEGAWVRHGRTPCQWAPVAGVQEPQESDSDSDDWRLDEVLGLGMQLP